MTSFSLISPIDQPLGNRRLLHDLKKALEDDRFSDFRLIVAYAKSGPLYRLQELLKKWRIAGKTSAAIIGLNQRGTSIEALEQALDLFDTVYVTFGSGITFHPKMYLFKGEKYAEAFIGSNNLTVGGTEKNFEATVHLQLDLSEDKDSFSELDYSWSSLLPNSCDMTRILDQEMFKQLISGETIINEISMHTKLIDDSKASIGLGWTSNMHVKPESPLPKELYGKVKKGSVKKKKIQHSYASGDAHVTPTKPIHIAAPSKKFVIQIKPHGNGEIFLSRTAVLQNPNFFGWPFKGSTTPKNPNNPSYPQLDPDPVVNIYVFGKYKEPKLVLHDYELNTVYYEIKSEIRVTASPLVGVVPEYSIMIMELQELDDKTSGDKSRTPLKYNIIIHTPDSPQYKTWEQACNQTMPSGGRKSRKFGWF